MRTPPRSTRSAARPARPHLRLWSAAALAAFAGACSSGPAPTAYDLTAPAGRARGALAMQVAVAEPAALQAFAGQQIIVKDASGTISFLGGGQWADALPRLVQTRLIQTFENASELRAVVRPTSGATADLQLTSEIRSFEVRTPDNQALVQISVKLIGERTGRVLAGRIFTARVPVAAIETPNAARALDEALSAAMLDIVRWVSSARLVTPAPPAESAASG